MYENFLPHEEVAAQEQEAPEQEEHEESESGQSAFDAFEQDYQGPLLAQELESVQQFVDPAPDVQDEY